MKRCLLICEGPNDELVFSMLKDVFDESLFEVKPLHRCCADVQDLSENVETIVSEILSKEHGYNREDFDEICFLIDSDGVFVDESLIIENKSISHTNYRADSIECKERKLMIIRNRNRIKNINDLLNDGKYKIYYNSRNLEHAFDSNYSGRINDKTKKRFALNVVANYSDNQKNLLNKLHEMNKSKTTNLKKSWEYLMKENNCLSSTSNVFVFLFDHINELRPECKEIVKTLITFNGGRPW